MSIRDNYLMVMENIAAACAQCGRGEGEVKLITVTKFVDTGRIAEAVAAGARHVGENRAQEFRDKLDFFKENGLDAHLIGQLQTNKVKYVIGNASLIQSVDRLELAKEISRLAVKAGITQNVLAEVNIGGEAQKGGIAPCELKDLLSIISELPGIRVKGLMCVPPAVGEEEARRYFASMRRLFEDIASAGIPGVDMRELSMGMSGDYAEAIEAGKALAELGIQARIINMATIKPLDEELVLKCAKECGKIITCEEHSIIGGLGEAVCSYLAETCPVPVKRIGVNDKFGCSGTAAEVLKAYGLSAEHIVEVTKAFLNR